ncbi:SDR family oxidoreductase [Cognatilysobacter bugurensis]|uniref:Short-chain dehydrogenase n=1 Tax=Cognatilysobacter bugurensis TaxID=543356 RepID=A0A918STJ8_9GAMM|nr:SDR family oxidoreductase [Lysobacter bugurensis]GHA69128.1 short-chain dehydrogenase [Lysobacter bugurensis]
MSHDLKPIEEQVIVVTGASSGIGLATVLGAAKRGAKVVLVARSADTLGDVQRRIRDSGGDAIIAIADVADRGALEDAARMAIERFGRIDTWVNDAGVSVYGRLDEVSNEDSRRLFETNFWGTVNGALTALPYLKRQGGALINVGSEVSDAVIPYQGMYSASKHAVKGFTDALRIEVELLDKAPVEVVLIQPTAVDTPYPEHAANYMAEAPKLPTPMIEPEDVAEAILKAAEEGGRDITVGAMAKIDTTVSKLMPSVGDRMAKMQADRQQRDEPAGDRRGTLYRPGEGGEVHGRGG